MHRLHPHQALLLTALALSSSSTAIATATSSSSSLDHSVTNAPSPLVHRDIDCVRHTLCLAWPRHQPRLKPCCILLAMLHLHPRRASPPSCTMTWTPQDVPFLIADAMPTLSVMSCSGSSSSRLCQAISTTLESFIRVILQHHLAVGELLLCRRRVPNPKASSFPTLLHSYRRS